MRYGKVITAAVFVLAAALVAAVTIQILYDKREAVPDTDADLVGEASAEATVIEKESFLLIAEDNYLNLYNSDTGGSLKKSERLNTSIFPEGDIAELRRGIVFDNEREAYEMMENFID